MTTAPSLLPETPSDEGRLLSFRTFSALKNLPPEPPWLWDGLIAEGTLSMLVGQPFAGKSTLIGALLKAMEAGEPFLDRPTKPASAVVLTEEDDSTLKAKADALGLVGLRSVFAGPREGVFDHDWRTLVAEATEVALEGGHKLLVIDTFSGLANLEAEEENDAGAITARLRTLQVAKGKGLAVLFLHHTNKLGHARGSSAFRGVADVTARMRRDRGGPSFRLDVESRFSAPPAIRGKLLQPPGGWTYVAGKERARALGEALPEDPESRLLRALREAGPDGLTYTAFDLIPGLSEDVAKKRLPALLGRRVQRAGAGTKGDPYRWYLI